MTVEYFGRQYEITPAIRDEVESGLGKLTKILGDNFKSKVILTVEKHRNIAEITVKRRRGHLVGLAEATDMVAAVSQALEHIETQVLRYNGRRRTTHRKAKDKTLDRLRWKPSPRRRSPWALPRQPPFRWWCTSFLPSPAPRKHTWCNRAILWLCAR